MVVKTTQNRWKMLSLVPGIKGCEVQGTGPTSTAQRATLSSETSAWPQIPTRTPKPYLVFLLSVTEDYEPGLPAAENADLSTWASSAAASPEVPLPRRGPHTSLSGLPASPELGAASSP